MLDSDRKTGATKRQRGVSDGHASIRMRNRDAILTAALTQFVDRGYEAVSVRDITTCAKVALGTFYNHFPDKEALFRFLIDRHVEQAIPRQRLIRRSARTFPEWLEGYFRHLFDEVLSDPTTHALFRRNAAVIREVVQSPAHLSSLRALSEDIEAAIESGLLAPVDVEMLTMTIMGISVELSAIVARRGRKETGDVERFAVDLLLNGLQQGEGTNPKAAQ